MMAEMLRASRPRPPDDVGSELDAAASGNSANAELDELVRAVFEQRPGALEAFLKAAAPMVRRICRGVMGRDSADLEDAIQDCLIDVARALGQFRFEASVVHYVAKVTMRRAIAARRRARSRWRNQIALELHEPGVAVPDSGVVVRADMIRNLLEELNEDQASALLLRVILGYSIEEIAALTGVSVNTVKTRLRLGKNQLRRRMERSGEVRRAGR